MSKRINIILGNGFSIDFMKFYSSLDGKAKNINLSNLFIDGAKLKCHWIKNLVFFHLEILQIYGVLAQDQV